MQNMESEKCRVLEARPPIAVVFCYQHKIIRASSAEPRLLFPNRVRGGGGRGRKGGNESTGDTIDRG